MSLLTIVQAVCERQGTPVPTTVLGDTGDANIVQMRALLEEDGQSLVKRHDLEAIVYEVTHTTVAAEDQGAIATIAGSGFRYIKNQTIWDRDTRLPILGPLEAGDWQALLAVQVSGPRYRFRIRGGRLLVNPAPTAGLTWKFEAVSKHWILDPDGTTKKTFFSSDNDTLLYDEEVAMIGLRWRWQKEKGLSYAELFNEYEAQVKQLFGRDGSKPILHQDDPGARGPQPGIYVPDGSWNLP